MRPLHSCGAYSLSRYSITLSEAPMLSMIPPESPSHSGHESMQFKMIQPMQMMLGPYK